MYIPNPRCFGWSLVTLALALSTCPAFCDYQQNGKLSSGSVYGGHSYQHILVEEAEQSDHGRYTDGNSGNKWYWDDSGKRLPGYSLGFVCWLLTWFGLLVTSLVTLCKFKQELY